MDLIIFVLLSLTSTKNFLKGLYFLPSIFIILFDSFVSFHIYLICDFLKISFTVNWKTYNINEIYDCADFHLHNLNAKEILFQKFSTRSAPSPLFTDECSWHLYCLETSHIISKTHPCIANTVIVKLHVKIFR